MSIRTKAEILKDINDVECRLSPENLTCDGELPKYAWKKKLSDLRRQRKALVRELGREPKFEELFGY